MACESSREPLASHISVDLLGFLSAGIGRQDLLKAAYESGFMYQLGIRIAAPEPNYREGINKNFPAVLPISCVRQQVSAAFRW